LWLQGAAAVVDKLVAVAALVACLRLQLVLLFLEHTPLPLVLVA
jgi:hypothetical protein